MAQEVYDLVVSQDPPGRFLMREGGDMMKGRSGGPSLTSMSAISGGRSYWVKIDDSKAMAKTSQALREGAPTIRAAAREAEPSGEAASRSSGRRKKKQSEPARKAKSSTSIRTISSKERKKRRDVPAVEKADVRQDDDGKAMRQSSRIFPKIKSAPVPAPLAASESMVDAAGDEISLPMGPDVSNAKQPSGGSGGDLLTPEQVAAAEAHFRHGTLIGSPIPGHGKELMMPPPLPPMIPADTGLPPVPPVAMTHPDALRTESGELREKFDEIQAAEADKQLSEVLHLERAMTSTPPPPTETVVHGRYEAAVGVQPAGQQQQGESTYTPTPHLLPTMSPVISPSYMYSLGTPTVLSNVMGSPNFSAMFASPGAGINGNHVFPPPPPPIHAPVATQANASVGGSNLNRSHSLAFSDSNSGISAIDPHEDFKNVFEYEDSNVAHSVGSVSGGVVQKHGGGNGAGSRNHASRQPTALSAPPPLATAGVEAASRASRAIVSPVLTSHPTSATTQGVAPIGQTEVARSSSNGNKKRTCQGSRKDMGRSSHSDTSRSVPTRNGNNAFNGAAALVVDPTQSKKPMLYSSTKSYTARRAAIGTLCLSTSFIFALISFSPFFFHIPVGRAYPTSRIYLMPNASIQNREASTRE